MTWFTQTLGGLPLLLLLLTRPATAGSATWLAGPGSGDWNTPANWTGATVPNTAADTAPFGVSSGAAVSLSANTVVNGITFNSGSNAFTITAAPWFTLTLSGTSIINNSGIAQNFVTATDGFGGQGQISFINNATAGINAAFTNNGGKAVVSNAQGGSTQFFDTATAGSGAFTNNGSTVVGAGSGTTVFNDTATAGNGTFTNNGGARGGATYFLVHSTAGNGAFTSSGGSAGGAGGGSTYFSDNATAANGTFTANGGTASRTSGGNTYFAANSTAGNGTFVNNGATASGAGGGYTDFSDTTTAGSGIFINNGSTVSGAGEGSTLFFNSSTAGNGTFANNGATASGAFGGGTDFSGSSTAGNGIFTAYGGANGGSGGSINFSGTSTGGTATVKIYGSGNLNISAHNAPGVTIGSVEGTGNVFLGSRNLTVGSNNLSTIFAGVAQDGTGGSLTKTGIGTLTLSGANTYTGGTAILAGTVLANNASGSAFGTGPVTVAKGATLGGSGFIDGTTTISDGGHLAPGSPPSALTFTKGLTLASGAVLDFQIGTSSGHIAVTGGMLTGPVGTGGIAINLSNAGGFTSGVSYTLFNFISGQTSSLDVADFTLGSLIGNTIASNYSFNLNATSFTLTYNPITTQPLTQTLASGESLTLCVGTSAVAPVSYRWLFNGGLIAGATGANLALANVQPASVGLYTAIVTDSVGSTTSDPAIIGVATTSKAIGAGSAIGSNIVHPNGNIFDQVLLTGAAVAVTADAGRITRTSFVDLTDNIVQVEFSGAGTLSLVLDSPSGPAVPVNYNQPTVSYMKGHAGIVITGADDTTNVSVFTVGRATAFDPAGGFNILLPVSATNSPANNGSALFLGHSTKNYSGMAGVAFIAISSTNSKFGGLRASN